MSIFKDGNSLVLEGNYQKIGIVFGLVFAAFGGSFFLYPEFWGSGGDLFIPGIIFGLMGLAAVFLAQDRAAIFDKGMNKFFTSSTNLIFGTKEKDYGPLLNISKIVLMTYQDERDRLKERLKAILADGKEVFLEDGGEEEGKQIAEFLGVSFSRDDRGTLTFTEAINEAKKAMGIEK